MMMMIIVIVVMMFEADNPGGGGGSLRPKPASHCNEQCPRHANIEKASKAKVQSNDSPKVLCNLLSNISNSISFLNFVLFIKCSERAYRL